MTSLSYGIDMPYEVQLEHTSDPSNNHMVILGPQRSPGQPFTRHRLDPGVYMVSLAYNGAAEATLIHVGAGPDNRVSVPTGTAGRPRTSAPMKISVQHGTEYLYVVAPGTGGAARATISVIPASTFDEMEESAQGASVLSEISTLKTTKADKSALEATNYIKGSAEDLNALTSDNDFGMWRTAANCLNTPGPGFYHVLVYGAAGTTHRIQKATRYGSQTVPSEHIRVLDTSAAGVWGPWERVDIRNDTSVGTRIFAGNTMIYGDTGIRTIASWDENGVVTGDLPPQLVPQPRFSGRYRIGRRGDVVSVYLERAQIAIIGEVMTLPHGFRPVADSLAHTQAVVYADGTPGKVRVAPGGLSFAEEGKVLGERIGVGTQPARIQFDTSSSWPSTLPGLPV